MGGRWEGGRTCGPQGGRPHEEGTGVCVAVSLLLGPSSVLLLLAVVLLLVVVVMRPRHCKLKWWKWLWRGGTWACVLCAWVVHE